MANESVQSCTAIPEAKERLPLLDLQRACPIFEPERTREEQDVKESAKDRQSHALHVVQMDVLYPSLNPLFQSTKMHVFLGKVPRLAKRRAVSSFARASRQRA